MTRVYDKIDDLIELIKTSDRDTLIKQIDEFYDYSVEIFKLFDKVMAKSGILNNNSIVPERNHILRKINKIKALFDAEYINKKRIIELLNKISNSYFVLGCAISGD